jgi:hypothetical protein
MVGAIQSPGTYTVMTGTFHSANHADFGASQDARLAPQRLPAQLPLVTPTLVP